MEESAAEAALAVAVAADGDAELPVHPFNGYPMPHGHPLLTLIGLLAFIPPGWSQELEPRRWNHLPIDANFLGGGYAYTDGEVFFNPLLRIEDATLDLHTLSLKYIRTFELAGKSARFDLGVAYQNGAWSGLLDGAPARAERSGWDHPQRSSPTRLLGLRFDPSGHNPWSVNLQV